MVIQSVWLLHHKASLDAHSQMNLDGSTFMLGVGVVPAPSMKEALALFGTYLRANKMELLELWKCERWDQKNFASEALEDKQINRAADKSLANNVIHYACGVSSEALDCEDEPLSSHATP